MLKKRWQLTGSATEIAIAEEASDEIFYPFERLTAMPGVPELGWADLNSRGFATPQELARAHGIDKHDGDVPHGLVGVDEQQRRYTMGLIYIMSGRIYIERSLAHHRRQLAKHVIGMEAFHAVDIFDMVEAQRAEFMRLWNKGGTWWEVVSYQDEYFRLGGEAFMYEGLGAYCDWNLGPNPFLHDAGVEPADVRRILGVERTDFKRREHFGKSKVYHALEHYPKKIGTALLTTDGLRPCKICLKKGYL